MPELTEHDRWLIGQAREMAAVSGDDATCELTGETDPDWAYRRYAGRTKSLFAELADRLEQALGT